MYLKGSVTLRPLEKLKKAEKARISPSRVVVLPSPIQSQRDPQCPKEHLDA